ncbi:MAG: hypothetical protein MUF08_10840 [Burkholderiaceae bacterium]|jgi:hypothetical protein|nr:hypothetical protein [Burkholderiaceae bacterium]MCU0965525.1 hypothetical protein [Burkholderiaceae bacterium]
MNPPTLPDTRRVDRSKIDEYLLHPVNGRGKAAFFQVFGFSLERWEELRDALLEHATAWPVAEVAVSPYGSRYLVRGGLRTPSGREPWPLVCSVWQADNGDVGARLITAYPA